MKYRVGDVVHPTNMLQSNKGKLYVIAESNYRSGYAIIDMETGLESAWWYDSQLEFVRHEEDTIFDKLLKIREEQMRKGMTE